MMAVGLEGSDGVAGVHVCWSGPEAEADKILAPFYALGEPIVNSVKSRDYVEIQQSWDQDETDPRNNATYMKGGFINDLPDGLIDKVIEGFDAPDGRGVSVFFQHSGGAIGRVPVDGTAFAHRKSKANMFVSVTWPLKSEAAQHVSYIREYWNTLEWATDGYYTVETSDESDKLRHANYQGNFPRLLEVKKKYDPSNLFRLNANIKT